MLCQRWLLEKALFVKLAQRKALIKKTDEELIFVA